MAADDGQDSSHGSPGDNVRSKGPSAFVPRWRKNTAESQPLETPAVDPSPGVHPNLDHERNTVSQGKRFQPRWRQRAEERAAKEEQQRTEEQAMSPGVAAEKPGFQPRWRRTAATDPASETSLEAKTPPAKRFQPKWRARAEPVPVAEAPAPEAPPKAGFTPRWKRTLAIPTVDPVVPSVEEATASVQAVASSVEVAIPAEKVASSVEVAIPVEEVASSVEVAIPVEEVASSVEAAIPVEEVASSVEAAIPVEEVAVVSLALGLAVPLAPALADPEPEARAEPLGGSAESAEVTFLGGASPLADEELWPEPEPEPAPELQKERLPRPQAAPPPKAVAEVVSTLIPVPNTEEVDWEVAEAPAPRSAELKFLPPPTPEIPPAREEPKVFKRLDEEAMAALKATATVLTAPNRPAPAPPPPPPQVIAPVPRPTPIRAPSLPPVAKVAPKKKQKSGFARRDASIPMGEVATFTRQFSVMIGAGLAIHQALNFFAESYTGPLGRVVDEVATKISSGFRLSAAMSQSPEVFSEVYVGLIELGESTSHIDEALEKLADLLEKEVRLAKRLQSALVYPAFLVLVSLAAVGVFLLYVLPTMIPLFKGFGMTLPWPTRMLLASRHFVWPGVGLLLLGWAFWWWFKPVWQRARRRKANWAHQVDRLTLKLPVFGKFMGQIATARVLFALATMIETGLPILSALKSCESVASNLEFASRLERAGAELRDGSTVTDALALYQVLPRSCLHLMSAGEESAQMAEMVQYAARFYEEEVEHSIDQFMSLVEPVIMCVMGVVVGFIVLSAMLPTVELINHLGS